MENHWVLHVWLCMSTMLPGKFGCNFDPGACFVARFWECCQFILHPPPQKKCIEYHYSNATQEGRSRDGKHNPHPPKTAPGLLSQTATYSIVALISLHLASDPATLSITLPLPRLSLTSSADVVNRTAVELNCHQCHPWRGVCVLTWRIWVPLTPATPALKTESRSAIHCGSMAIMNGTLYLRETRAS